MKLRRFWAVGRGPRWGRPLGSATAFQLVPLQENPGSATAKIYLRLEARWKGAQYRRGRGEGGREPACESPAPDSRNKDTEQASIGEQRVNRCHCACANTLQGLNLHISRTLARNCAVVFCKCAAMREDDEMICNSFRLNRANFLII